MTPETSDVPIAGLTDCDKEPIHIPGSIQSFGFLLSCRLDDWVVTHASENARIGGIAAGGMLGVPVNQLVGSDTFHALTNALASSVGPELPGRLFDVVLPDGQHCTAAIHAYRGAVIIDFEPALVTAEAGAPLFVVRNMLTRMQQAATIEDICTIAVNQVRTLIDFDRAMVYRFLPDGSGSVIAESRLDGVPSFLGHHYPASDIPQQARQLYLKNWLRLIADVEAAPIAIQAQARDALPLDLTYSALRSVSPVHIQYLKNMGVAASLSISIVVGGALWGLIACHNRTPRVVPADTRLAAEFFGQAFSLQLQTLARADVAEMLREARHRIDRIVLELPPGVPLRESLGQRLDDVRDVVPCDGVALWIDEELVTTGRCPPPPEIPKIAAALSASKNSSVFATHQLSVLHPPATRYAAQASGILAVPLSRAPGDYLMLFRREFIRTIDWAGNPNKPVQRDDDAVALSPRKSFELWREEVKNQSRVWEAHDRLTGEALRIALLEIVLKYNEIVAQERANADRQQRLQTAEFNHRVKNALALVGALVTQSREHNEDLRTFVADLQGRIRSLALAHDLASRPGMLDLQQLLEIELRPFSGTRERIVLEGPTVKLAESASGVMALVVHELATNASKYGALSAEGGEIRVAWRLDADGGCGLSWRERGGPVVTAPSKKGFGMLLIGSQIPFELGGRTDVRFEAAGLEVDLWLPPSALGKSHEGPSAGASGKVVPTAGLLTGLTAMLVEDSLIVALEVERRLRQLGVREVFLFGTLSHALQYADGLPVDFAVLDINLKGTTSYPVADVLLRRGIPFVFSTGYGSSHAAPAQFAGMPTLAKPFSDAELTDAILSVMNRRPPASA